MQKMGLPLFFADGRYLADRGLKTVVNQVFRTLLHSRLKLGIQRYIADDRFKGDIVLLEPREHDANFFGVNPMAFWKRQEALQHGFESVRATIDQNYDQLRAVLQRYGLEMSRAEAQKQAEEVRESRGWAADVDQEAVNEEEPPLRLVESS